MEDGFKNEINIANVYNNRKFKNLNEFQKEFIKKLFYDVNDEDIFKSRQCNKYSKPDIYIQLENNIKYISIKSGHCSYVHQEPIKQFILFLRELGVSTLTQKTILLFHYGDDTLDGSGNKRYTGQECGYRYKKYIKQANKELNDKRIIKEVLYRTVFQGSNSNWHLVDYLYYGDENFAIYTKRDDIENYLLEKDFNYSNIIHCGPLVFQPYLRDVDHKSKHIYKRNIISVKWLQFKKSLILINEINK